MELREVKASGLSWFFLCVCVSLWFSLLTGVQAAEYEQRQGHALLRLQAEKVESGQVEIRLSDVLTLTLIVEGRPALQVEPIQTLTPSKDWQLRQRMEPRQIPLADSRVRWQQQFQLVPLKPGEIPLPLAPLRFREDLDQERWEEAVWQPIPVRVVTEILTPDLSEIRDITPPEEIPAAPSRLVLWCGVALAFGALGLLLVLWRLWRRRGRQALALPPQQWALRELERIQARSCNTESEVEQFHTLLSDVIRQYLELRFHLPAPEQTTTEFLEEMRRSPELTPEQQRMLRDFLERCDLVKFARAVPSPEECQATAAMARGFVEQTTSVTAKREEAPQLTKE
jgi:hypothetical protein